MRFIIGNGSIQTVRWLLSSRVYIVCTSCVYRVFIVCTSRVLISVYLCRPPVEPIRSEPGRATRAGCAMTTVSPTSIGSAHRRTLIENNTPTLRSHCGGVLRTPIARYSPHAPVHAARADAQHDDDAEHPHLLSLPHVYHTASVAGMAYTF